MKRTRRKKPDGYPIRDRAAGKHQRRVRWAIIENVILPDWREVRVRPIQPNAILPPAR